MQTAETKGASLHAVTQQEILPGSGASDLKNWRLLCLVNCLSCLPATVVDCQNELQEAERCLRPACPVPGGSANATNHVRRRGGESRATEDTRFVCFSAFGAVNLLVIMDW